MNETVLLGLHFLYTPLEMSHHGQGLPFDVPVLLPRLTGIVTEIKRNISYPEPGTSLHCGTFSDMFQMTFPEIWSLLLIVRFVDRHAHIAGIEIV